MVVQRPLHVYKADAEGLPQDRPALPGDQADEEDQDGHGASAQPDGANRLPSNLHHEPPLRKREEGEATTAHFLASFEVTSPLYLTAPRAPGDFPSSLFPCPSSPLLCYKLLVRRSHTSPCDVPMSSHARNSLMR